MFSEADASLTRRFHACTNILATVKVLLVLVGNSVLEFLGAGGGAVEDAGDKLVCCSPNQTNR